MNMVFSAIRDTRKAYRILIGKCNLNRKLGRHRRTEEVYLYGLEKLRREDTNLSFWAQNEFQRLNFVKTVMTLWVSRKVENFLRFQRAKNSDAD